MLNFKLNANLFPIEIDLDLLEKVDKSIKKELFWNHMYIVTSNVGNEVFQSFLDYWTKSKELPICFDNFNEFVEINNEFHLDQMDKLLKEKENELGINDLTYLYALNDPKIKNKSYYECLIAQNLDHFITRYGENLMKSPTTSLINIFNHNERKMFNHNYAYEMIDNYVKKTNDVGKLLLFQFIDITQLNKKNYNDSISEEKLQIRSGLMPNINIQYLGTILKDIAQFKQEKEELMQLKDEMKELAKNVIYCERCVKYEAKKMISQQASDSLLIRNEFVDKLAKALADIESLQESKKMCNVDICFVKNEIENIKSTTEESLRCLKYEVRQLKQRPIIDPKEIENIKSTTEESLRCLKYEVRQLKQRPIIDPKEIENIKSTTEESLRCLKYEVRQLKQRPIIDPKEI